MLGLTDLKQTGFYQEAFVEGREEGTQQAKRDFVQRLANRGEKFRRDCPIV